MTTKPTSEPDATLPGAGSPRSSPSIFKRTCPVCERSFSWLELWRFSDRLGRRKEAPCPRCGTPLSWSKVPHWTRSIAACLLILVSLTLVYATAFTERSLGGSFDIRLALPFGALILAGVMLAATWRLRLVQRSEQQ
jgi:hypothetical protein